jgi:hypothetical protein
MCTLSFLAGTDGFSLAMNRDEQRTRVDALPPAAHQCGTLSAWYPSEPGGGTWIGINSRGFALALVNSYAHPHKLSAWSRGHLIPKLLATDSVVSLEEDLAVAGPDRFNPFRLVAVDPGLRAVREFHWNGRSLSRAVFPWQIAHWFSSAFDEARVIRARSETAQLAASEPDAGSLVWARRLHSTHEPERGACSICMHRPDARTVSYTEITWHAGKVQISYHAGAPCESKRGAVAPDHQACRSESFFSRGPCTPA